MRTQILEDYPLEQEFLDIAWKYVDTCGNCGSCAGGKPKVVFGKEFEKVCGCTFRIDNPNEAELGFMKKMVEIRMKECQCDGDSEKMEP